MKQSNTMKKVSVLIVALASLLTFNVGSQERKSLTMPFDGGTLTFQYYEKDGVKVPDGPMEFTKKNYIEKGECKDGYREGTWIAKIENKTNSTVYNYSYRKGMLDGPTTFTFTTSDKSLEKLHTPYEKFNFKNGRLFGENKIITSTKDTIYCNFGDDGKKIGTWKKVKEDSTILFEYDNNKLIGVYEIDVLGQKTPVNQAEESNLFMNLFVFNDRFRQVFFDFRDKKRPELPTLCDNKYGYLDVWVNDKKDEW